MPVAFLRSPHQVGFLFFSDMIETATAPQSTNLQPKIVTFDQLRATLLPIVTGYKWAEDTLRDLWLLGAPIPNPLDGQPEKRILLPTQFRTWFDDVQKKMGIDTPGDFIYSRTDAKTPTRARDAANSLDMSNGKTIYLPKRLR